MVCPPLCGDYPLAKAKASGLYPCTLYRWTNHGLTILRKTIERYLDSVPSLTFNTIKTQLTMHSFNSPRYLQSK